MDMDDDEELYINRVIESDLPDAVTMKVMKDYTNKCDVMAKLKYCIIHKGNIHTKDPDLAPYKHVFPELSVMRQLIMRGEKIVVPRALQEDVVALAHSTHQGTGSTKTKQFLRARVWFPAMDRMVDEYVQSCIPCQAATSGTSVEPVKPTELPEHPWEHLAMDFKGPVGKEFYFLVVVDEYSRYPEVAVVKSTAAEAVLPELDRIYSIRPDLLYIRSTIIDHIAVNVECNIIESGVLKLALSDHYLVYAIRKFRGNIPCNHKVIKTRQMKNDD